MRIITYNEFFVHMPMILAFIHIKDTSFLNVCMKVALWIMHYILFDITFVITPVPVASIVSRIYPLVKMVANTHVHIQP